MKNLDKIDHHSIVFQEDSNDAKIDLFYLTVTSAINIIDDQR